MMLRRRGPRWLWITGVFVAVIGALAAFAWFVWLPEYRPDLRDGERYGIDVSNHQGEIDWERVANDGIEFAYIKATEGGDFVDKRFATNWTGAAGAGLDRGAYHFFTLCRPGDEQARHFLSIVHDHSDALAPAVDLELAGNCSRRPAFDELRREILSFLDIVESGTSKQAVLYIGAEFERRYPIRDVLDRPLWHFRFLRRPDVDGWVVWQVMSLARVDGIDGRVDLDVMRNQSDDGDG